jgi:uncharacterized protein
MPSRSKLELHLASFPSVLVGYSGGVDSTLLAVVARNVLGREKAAAAMGISPSLPASQRERAQMMARQFDLEMIEVPTNELDDPDYVANEPSRCYFCKLELWRTLERVARERGYDVLADGANADDTTEHRPGLQAATEFGVRSPLLEAGYTKEDVRAEARALDIPVWDAPAAPCLSSRIMYGLEVSPDRLSQVEQSEAVLRDLGIEGDLRVRHRGEEASIEVHEAQFDKVRAHRSGIGRRLLAIGFDRVVLDLRGYRRGSLLVQSEDHVELIAEVDE